MVYSLAVKDPSIAALVISGFAYRDDASTTLPKNMLMIFGKYDEFRQRMKELQIQSNLTVIKGAPHPFLGKQVWFDEMISVTDAFFQRTLKKRM